MFEGEESEPFPTHEEVAGEKANPDAGEPATGGKPDDKAPAESGRGRDAPPGEEKSDATPEIGGEEGNPGQTQVSGDPGEPPDRESDR